MRRDPASWAAVLFLLAAYVAAGKLCLRLAFVNPSVSPVWAPTGIAIATLLVLGRRLWPGVLLGAFLVNVTTAGTVATSLGISIGNALEAVVGAGLVARFAHGRRAFERPRDVMAFAALAGGCATTLSATVGVTSLAAAGFADWADFGGVWLTWWLGDTAGALLVTPLIVLWTEPLRLVWSRRQAAEAALLAAALAGTGGLIFGGWSAASQAGDTRAYLATPVLMWAALRFGPRGAATATAMLAAMAMAGTLSSLGPFAQPSPHMSLLTLQTFMGTVSIMSLLLAAAASEQRRSEAEVRRLNADLAARVDARTRELQVASAELISSGQQYRALMESAPDALLVADSAGTILLINARTEEMFGYRRDELIGRPVEALIPEPYRAEHVHDRARFFNEPRVRSMGLGVQLRGRRRDGSEFPVEISLSPLQAPDGPTVCAAIRDMTERQRESEALRDSQQALERAQAVAHVGSWLSGPAPDSALEWSKETHRIFGVDAASFGGRVEDFFARVHPDDVAAVREAARAALAGEAPYAIDHRIVRPDHSVRWVHEQAEIVRDVQGQPVRLIGTVQDITDRKQLQEQLMQSQKIEAVGRLAGGIAHDFNNLLGVIGGFSDLALKDLGPDHRARRRVEEIQKAAARAATLTRQLLAFSRKQLLQPRVVDVSAIAADMETMLCRLIGEDIQFITSFAPGLAAVNADPAQVEQVILNLAINARDAMPHGGKLILETASVELDERFVRTHAGASPGPHIMLAVSDTGHGMTAETMSHIFEPFFTTKPQGKGTGLGLAMTYGIVKQSGGYVTVYSEVGKGTSFKVYLPRVEAETLERPVASEPPAAPRGNEAILLVEDETSLRHVVREMLEAAGYRILESASPEEALVTAAGSKEAIDLLLTDVVMPGGSGENLRRQLHATRPHLPVLFMSGYTDEAINHHGVLEEGTHFLQKPFTVDALLRAVRNALDGC